MRVAKIATLTTLTLGFVAVLSTAAGAAFAAVGDGTPDDVANDNPSDAFGVIRDWGLENAPTIVAIIGGIFLVSLTFSLIRRGLRRSKSAMGI